MHSRIRIGFLAFSLAFAGLTASSLAESHELQLSDGAAWRGDDGDEVRVVFTEQGVEQAMTGTLESIQGREGFEIIVIKGDVAGRTARKAIFAPDIISMSTTSAGDGETTKSSDLKANDNADAKPENTHQGVFFMPC